jgi:hypothetical protein
MGTGRVGSLSLTKLLQAQYGDAGSRRLPLVSHEGRPLLPWSLGEDPAQAEAAARRRLAMLSARAGRARARRAAGSGDGRRVHVGDVASWTLPLARALLHSSVCSVFLVLQRERADVVRSFTAKSGPSDYWRPRGSAASADETFWAPFFPKFENESSKEAAIGAYWDLYAAKSARLAADWPQRVAIFASPACLTEAGQSWALLRFAGYESPVVPDRVIHENAG